MICDHCYEEKEDVEYLADPYLDEICDKKEYSYFCRECYEYRCDEI